MHLREWRESKAIKLADAVDQTGLNGGYLSQLERGMKWPSPQVIAIIIKWTKGAVTANDLFDHLDMSLFAARPVRMGKRGGSKGPTRTGGPNGKTKKVSRQEKEARRD